MTTTIYELGNFSGTLTVWTVVKETAKQFALERKTDKGHHREHRLDKKKLEKADFRGLWTTNPAKAWAYLAEIAKEKDQHKEAFDTRIEQGFAELARLGYRPEVIG